MTSNQQMPGAIDESPQKGESKPKKVKHTWDWTERTEEPSPTTKWKANVPDDVRTRGQAKAKSKETIPPEASGQVSRTTSAEGKAGTTKGKGWVPKPCLD